MWKRNKRNRIHFGKNSVVIRLYTYRQENDLKVSDYMKKRNPVIDQAEHRGYEKGFAAGIEAGRTQSINFIDHWINNLEDEPGIGPKTAERIRNEFYKKYGK